MPSKTDSRTRMANSRKVGQRIRASNTDKPDDHLYLQIVRALKEEIVRGTYPVGSRLPTEEVLCERFGVSRYTVREALRRLREDSLVSSRQGAGTIVVAPRPAGSFVHEVMSINDLVAFAIDVRFAIDTIEMIEIDDGLALRTGIPSGENWLAIHGFRHREGTELPVCWTEVYVNSEFAAVGRLVQRHTGPIFHLIEDLFGQTIVEVHQEIAVALISPALASGLKVQAGTTALEVQRTYKMASGKVAQVAINTHPGSRFRHSMTMRRVKA